MTNKLLATVFSKWKMPAVASKDVSVRIPYNTHVGKQVVITEVVPFDVGYGLKEYMVYMNVTDTGGKLVGRSMRSK